jgi:Lrp/AsnC family transcriptional regulator, leucine-responsive regulatory protein
LADSLYTWKVLAIELDITDRKILKVLTDDARCSASEVGRLVGMSPPAAKRRIDRLEKAGVIKGYTISVDRVQLGERIEAFIELTFAPGSQVAEVDNALIDLPELVASYTLAGEPDALAHVRVRELDDLKGVVDRIRRGRRGGPKVTATRTVIVLGRTESQR